MNLCAWHTLSILSYLCEKKFGEEATLEIIRELLKVFSVPTTGTEEARNAFIYLSGDFEDALQVSSAVTGRADYIVTRDKAGFNQSPIPAINPQEILSRIRNL